MIETPTFLSSDIIAEKSGYRTNNFLEPILCYFLLLPDFLEF